MASVRTRILLALVLVAWLSIGITGAVTTRLTVERFGQYLRSADTVPQMPGMGPGMTERMARMMGAPELRFLAGVRRGVWIAAFFGALLALVAGTFTARQITAPLRALSRAARRVGAGDLGQAVPSDRADELGEVARAFNAMTAQLRQAEDARRRLLADVAHELGTPLAVLQANLEGMLDGVVEQTPERISSLHTHTQVLARLVRDLRDLALAQEGQLPLDRVPLDLAGLVREVADVVRPVADEKGILLEVRAAEPIAIVADHDRLAQVLHNLLANAVRYTSGRGSITVTAVERRASPDAAPEAIVEVADTGPGIPADDLPRVFERFHRVDPSRSRATGGAGLGLAIVKHLVEAHGGRVWVTSREGGGSTFGFAVPVSQLEGEPTAAG